RIMLMGAPPQDAAKYEGDQSAPCQYFLAMSGRWRLKTRLEAPLRLFTSAETASLGKHSISRCTWSRSPSIHQVFPFAVGGFVPENRRVAGAPNIGAPKVV